MRPKHLFALICALVISVSLLAREEEDNTISPYFIVSCPDSTTDTAGRTILSLPLSGLLTGKNTAVLNLSEHAPSLENGIYIVSIHSGGRQLGQQRVTFAGG